MLPDDRPERLVLRLHIRTSFPGSPPPSFFFINIRDLDFTSPKREFLLIYALENNQILSYYLSQRGSPRVSESPASGQWALFTDKEEQPSSLQFLPLPSTTEKQRKPLSTSAVDPAGWRE